MNGKAILALIEKHIEKGIIALAGLFLVGMIWMYGIKTPNKVPFEGAELGPRELHANVLEKAKQLESAMRSAKADDVKPQSSAKKLVDAHNEGIYAALTPTKPDAPDAKGYKLQPVARTLMTGGKEAVVPGLTEAEEATGSTELVTPLPPEQPVLSFGRSLAVRKSIRLGDSAAPRPGAAPAAKDEKAGDPMEVAWVSVAAYWDREAQRGEMTKNGYAAYRAKVYVSGTEVERQELLATGEWSEPKLVEGSKAMPELKIPEPAIDDRGALVNKPDIEEAFRAVRSEQNTIIQPAFYTVAAGDEWKLPPLEGHAPVDEEEGVVAPKKLPKPAAKPQPPRGRQPMPPIGGRGAPNTGGIDGVMIGRDGGQANTGGVDRKAAKQGEKQAKDDLKEGRDLMSKKDYSAAANKFQAVVNNPNASPGDKRQAEAELEKAQKKAAESSTPSPTGRIASDAGGEVGRVGIIDDVVGGRAPGTPSRGVMPGPGASPSGPASTLVTHPDRSVPAAFYHDDTVESGKTYRYRMRVNLWNRYVGQIKSLKDPAGPRQAVLHGEWSLWSEPVMTTPQTHFYVNSLKPGTDKVSVEVWKWIKGKWVKRSAEAGVGDVIGGEFVLTPKERGEESGAEGDKKSTEKPKPEDFTTGAVVLDIRVEQPVKVRQNRGKGQFDYNERKSLVLVYLDPADGQVKERTQVFDASDPLRKKLKEQAGDGS